MGGGEPEQGIVLFVGTSPGSAEAVADAGFDVERASGAGAALDRLDRGPVDCAVVGHAPPGVDGPALAERLAERRPGLPIVIRPVEGSESLASEAVAAGVSAYVPSDEGPDRLVSAVERVVGGASGRGRFETELGRQNERLEEFAGVVSHDLRNPLNVAQARLDLAREDGSDADLDAVAGALSRMSAIIEDTLTLARQGRTAVEPEAVDLATFAGRCWRLVGTAGAELETGESFAFRADPDRLHSLFENLFGNCVRHGSADGRSDAGTDADQGGTDADVGNADPTVRVGAIDRRGFFVEDDGPGIPVEERGRVFETGYTTSVDGTGFGLAIVEEIVEAHGWEVAVATSEAGGARFEVTGVEPVD